MIPVEALVIMPGILLVLLPVFAAVEGTPLSSIVHRSSDLGWSAGQDVTDVFAAVLRSQALRPGDELRLDHTYRIRGTHQLPDDFTLSAENGAGFDVIDAAPDNGAVFLELGNRTGLRNVTLRYLDTPEPGPEAGTNPRRAVDFHERIGIQASGKNDNRIEDCALVGSIAHHVRLEDCKRPRIVGSHIVGGFWAVFLRGHVRGAVFRRTVFEQGQGDGIKTGRSDGDGGTERALVDECVFQDCGRDGIDTTGGWKDSVVRHTIFRRLFSGMDIKSFFEKPEHLSSGVSNTGIRIEHCRFTDMANAVTFSTLDRGVRYNNGQHFLTPETALEHAPHNVDIIDCVVERTGASPVRMLLLKGGHTIRYRNARFLGDGIELLNRINVHEVFGNKEMSSEVADALDFNVTGTLGETGIPSAPGEMSIPFAFGPQSLPLDRPSNPETTQPDTGSRTE